MEIRNEEDEEHIANSLNETRRTKTTQEIESLFASPSKNVTYDINTFPYIESKSTSGIFFFDSSGYPVFNFMRSCPYLDLPTPSFFNIPAPFEILSSSQGLLLCRDFVDYNYHLCNPFVHSSSSYLLIPPPPSSASHALCPPSVLSTDLRTPDDPCFYIACMEKQGASFCNLYTFHMYSSSDGEWFDNTQKIVTDAPVIESTGVSSADGSVYWLTEAPHQIVKYSIDGLLHGDFSRVFDLPEGCSDQHVKLQLGRMGCLGISLVAVTYNEMALFLLRDGCADSNSWESLCTLDVSSIFLPEKIELLRFEKEVALWIGDNIVFWTPLLDFGDDGGSFYGKMFNRMPEWIDVPNSICDSIPYVDTKIVPLHFVKSSSSDEVFSDDEVYSNDYLPYIFFF